MKPVFATLLIVSLVLTSSLLQTTTAQANPAGYPCDTKCDERCAKAGKEDRCKKYCNLCCKKCQCVPPGTYGNKAECPCYMDMLNSKGTSKCP